jgi:uncharacterized protein YndB with AHSA1/START domain
VAEPAETIRVAGLQFQRTLPGPIQRVWAHLTEPALLSGWYDAGSLIEPREGGTVSLNGGHIRGVVTQWRPHERFAHTWNVFGPDELVSPYPESYLTLELAEAGQGVHLTLTHFPVLERFEAQTAMGWATFLDILEDTLTGRPVGPRRAYFERNAARYGVDLEALQR